jgi:hypothetical protein
MFGGCWEHVVWLMALVKCVDEGARGYYPLIAVRTSLQDSARETPCSSSNLAFQLIMGQRIRRPLAKTVMSSCPCKRAEGAILPFTPFVVAIEDGVDNPVHAGDVDEADHGSRAATDFHKATLDDIGGAQLSP